MPCILAVSRPQTASTEEVLAWTAHSACKASCTCKDSTWLLLIPHQHRTSTEQTQPKKSTKPWLVDHKIPDIWWFPRSRLRQWIGTHSEPRPPHWRWQSHAWCRCPIFTSIKLGSTTKQHKNDVWGLASQSLGWDHFERQRIWYYRSLFSVCWALSAIKLHKVESPHGAEALIRNNDWMHTCCRETITTTGKTVDFELGRMVGA